jgi:hypothetical protein
MVRKQLFVTANEFDSILRNCYKFNMNDYDMYYWIQDFLKVYIPPYVEYKLVVVKTIPKIGRIKE